jgi:DNA-directed RNA polymerase specialized sigma24 family protein
MRHGYGRSDIDSNVRVGSRAAHGKEATSQEPVGEPVRSIRSREEIDKAIRTLPDAGWVRLRRVAAAFCLGRPLDAEDLLQEAFTRALNGSRKCPVDVDVVAFLAEAMHSIASDAAKARARHPERRAIALITDEGLAVDPPDCRPNAAEGLESADEVRRIKQAIVGLFADDVVAQVMVEGIMEGMEGEELREVTGLTKTAFASKRRLIRRRIETAFPDGWTL